MILTGKYDLTSKNDLTSKYDEVMEHIKLTAGARERILRNVAGTGTAARRNNIISLGDIKRLSAAAACLIALAAGIYALAKAVRPVVPDEQIDPGTATYGVLEYKTAAELSETLGFTVDDIAVIFPDASDIVYSDMFGTAQTDFTLGGYVVTFRKAVGGGDISGDYNEYDRTEQIEINGTAVTVKGGGDGFSLALWEKEGYAYSLRYETPVPLDTITETVSEFAL